MRNLIENYQIVETVITKVGSFSGKCVYEIYFDIHGEQRVVLIDYFYFNKKRNHHLKETITPKQGDDIIVVFDKSDNKSSSCLGFAISGIYLYLNWHNSSACTYCIKTGVVDAVEEVMDDYRVLFNSINLLIPKYYFGNNALKSGDTITAFCDYLYGEIKGCALNSRMLYLIT